MSSKKIVLMDYSPEEFSEQIGHILRPEIANQIHKVLEEIKSDDDKPMSLENACAFLKISKSTMSRYLKKGVIKYISFNPDNPRARKLFRLSDLEAFLKSGESKTLDELKDARDER